MNDYRRIYIAEMICNTPLTNMLSGHQFDLHYKATTRQIAETEMVRTSGQNEGNFIYFTSEERLPSVIDPPALLAGLCIDVGNIKFCDEITELFLLMEFGFEFSEAASLLTTDTPKKTVRTNVLLQLARDMVQWVKTCMKLQR